VRSSHELHEFHEFSRLVNPFSCQFVSFVAGFRRHCVSPVIKEQELRSGLLGAVIARSVVCDCASILQDEAISGLAREIAFVLAQARASQTMS